MKTTIPTFKVVFNAVNTQPPMQLAMLVAERYCARILVHLATAGERERDEVADEVDGLELTDSIAKGLVEVILID